MELVSCPLSTRSRFAHQRSLNQAGKDERRLKTIFNHLRDKPARDHESQVCWLEILPVFLVSQQTQWAVMEILGQDVQILRLVLRHSKCVCNFANSTEYSHEEICQERAVRALKSWLGIRERGFNIYVAGYSRTGRTTAVRNLLNER